MQLIQGVRGLPRLPGHLARIHGGDLSTEDVLICLICLIAITITITGMRFYGSNDPTNSIKVLKENPKD